MKGQRGDLYSRFGFVIQIHIRADFVFMNRTLTLRIIEKKTQYSYIVFVYIKTAIDERFVLRMNTNLSNFTTVNISTTNCHYAYT